MNQPVRRGQLNRGVTGFDVGCDRREKRAEDGSYLENDLPKNNCEQQRNCRTLEHGPRGLSDTRPVNRGCLRPEFAVIEETHQPAR